MDLEMIRRKNPTKFTLKQSKSKANVLLLSISKFLYSGWMEDYFYMNI